MAAPAPESKKADAAAPQPVGQEAPPPSTISGLIYGLQLAHFDFANWFYKPHGSIYDTQISTLVDANGIKREFIGYGLIGLAVLLLCTSMAPLVANLICIVYPFIATLGILRGGENTMETMRFLTYWSFFAVLSICDYKFGPVSTLYWIVKIIICVYLYLPQTQGAGVVYSLIVHPLLELFHAHIAPKFA